VTSPEQETMAESNFFFRFFFKLSSRLGSGQPEQARTPGGGSSSRARASAGAARAGEAVEQHARAGGQRAMSEQHQHARAGDQRAGGGNSGRIRLIPAAAN
jgi:hypothetical protein